MNGHGHRGQLAEEEGRRDEGDGGAHRGEVRDRADRGGRPGGAAPVLGQPGDGEQQHAAEDCGPAVEDERVDARAAALGRHVADRRARAARGAMRSRPQHGEPRVAERDARREREGQAGEREDDAAEQPRAQRLVAQRDRRDEGDVDGQHAEQHRREAGGHVLLAPVDERRTWRRTAATPRTPASTRSVRSERPLTRANTSRPTPASANRMPAPSSGGMSSSPTLIATHVLDQMATSRA